MACAGIYAVNTATTSVAQDGLIPLNTIVRRFGSALNLNGNGVVVTRQTGYYKVDYNVTATIQTAGDTNVTLYYNGVAVPAALATETVASGDTVTFVGSAIVRQTCCQDASAITMEISTAASIVNASMVVTKL